MKRIFYYNITYACNNHCRNCISHNVRIKRSSNVIVDDLRFIYNKFQVKETDEWTISGGEPTLSPYFCDIMDFCIQTSNHINLYSNGRILQEIPTDILKKINRIIVPLYGTDVVHNAYVGTNSFHETYDSLVNIINEYPDKIELKLILDGTDNITNLIRSPFWNAFINNIHFSITRLISEEEKSFSQSTINNASQIIEDLLDIGKTIRFYDFPFCRLSDSLKTMITSRFVEQNIYNHNIICGSTNKRYKIYQFDKPADYFLECDGCRFEKFCCKIMQNYFCPVITPKEAYISHE